METITWARVVVGVVLLAAAFGKWADLKSFATNIEQYRILPSSRILVAISALTIATGELLLGASLVVGLFPRWAPIGAMVLLALFTLAVLINLMRGRTNVACGCSRASGPGAGRIGVMRVLQNVSLIGLCALAAGWWVHDAGSFVMLTVCLAGFGMPTIVRLPSIIGGFLRPEDMVHGH